MFAIHTPNSATGKQFRYRSRITGDVTEFYAELGMIRIHFCGKRGTAEYVTVTRRDFLLRAQAVNDSLRVPQPADERKDQERLVATMLTVAKAAGDQGDPLSRRSVVNMLRNGPPRSSRVLSPGPTWETPFPEAARAPTHKPPVPLDVVAPQSFSVGRKTNVVAPKIIVTVR